jgi:hypothetical protein
MRVHQEDYEHPTQATRLRLAVFEQKPPETEAVQGLAPPESGFLVTEERLGAGKVVATLGFFPSREEALAQLHARSQELERQLYARVSLPA